MIIERVVAHPLTAPIEEPFAYSQAWVDVRVGMVVEIVTRDGAVGWGECYGPPGLIAAVIERAFAPMLEGEDALAGDALWERLYNSLRDHGQKGVVIQALSGVDIALWDLRGKHFGVPVHRLMGGPLRTRVQPYATGLYRRRGDAARLLAEEASGYLAQGFRAMKLKVGFGLDADMAAIEAVRRAIGPEVALMMDANHGYDTVDAIRLARAAEAYDIGWFEEPVPPEDVAGYREVRAATTIPIAGGEAEFTRYGFRELVTTRAVDIAQPDTCAAGGLSECKKIADMACAFGVRHVPHVWGSGIAIAAALQLLAVLPTTVPALHARQPLLEFDQTEHPFRDALITEPFALDDDGMVAVPTAPGLGIEVNREILEKFRAE
jgi:D-galactarolactone cycloisomerase